MNLKTTFLLILLAGAGVGGWYWTLSHKVEQPKSETLAFLEAMKPGRITEVEATRGKESLYTLKKVGNDWVLPGKWPCRPQEAEQIVSLLSSLHSRYIPAAINDKSDLKSFGLGDNPLTIKITTSDQSHTLRFGDEPGDTNRFTRPTFLRVDDKREIVRLGPGVTTALDRKLDYFQQRRLFPFERVAKEEESKDKIEQLDAAEIAVETPEAKFTLVKKDKDWLLKNAQRKKDETWESAGANDRLDPDRLESLLRAFPDVWAEKFVDKKDKSLEDFGLKAPAYSMFVSKAGGAKLKLLVGKVSESKTTVKPAPSPPQFGMPPRPPETITEEYRFAKLDGNDQIFEIKADKLKDIAIPLDELRDPRLARFKVDDVKRLEIQHGKQDLVLAKVTKKEKDVEKTKWVLEKPTKEEADTKQVEEALQKLADLQARDKDVLDKADLKAVGLDAPSARIKITIEEGKKKDTNDEEAKDKIKTRTIVLQVGAKEKDKVYVRVEGWPRVNLVGADILKLTERSDLAFRPRELWRVDRDAVTRIAIDADMPYALEHKDGKWKIAPLGADVAGKEIDDLANDLSHLQAERFEAAHVKDFAKYGLDKPAFKISLTAKDGKSHALEVGAKTEGGRFARRPGGDAVIVVADKTLANVRTDPLELLDRSLLNLDPLDIQRVRFEGASPFTLEEAKKGTWQVSNGSAPPIDINKGQLAAILTPFAKLRAEKFAAFGGKIDWDKFGLAKPAAKITVTVKDPGAGKDKSHVIELGKDAGKGTRFARIDGKDAVVVLGESVAALMQRHYVDFVDPRVLTLDLEAVSRIERQMKDAPLELTRRDDGWQITKPGIRDADNLTVFDLLKRTGNLQARRIAAYPARDLKTFGLDQPTAVVTLYLEDLGRKHVIKVGNLSKDATHNDTDERFAQVDDKAMVIVLSPELSRSLVAPALFYADRNLASFSGADRAELTRGGRTFVFTREDKGWQMTQPTKGKADSTELDDLVRGLQRLRADEIVAEKAGDLKKYGLDMPVADWRFKQGGADRLHLLVGAAENNKPNARRYAKLGDKGTIFLLSEKLSAKATADYRNRQVWEPFRTTQVDEITISGPEKPYTLFRKGPLWTVVGMPELQVRGPQLADTLGALAYVRVVEYVAEGKADLKAFGLEKPTWKIEAKVGKDKRELWLGAKQPGTQLFYAMVPGSGAVFTIDALDSVALARPLAELVVEEKKK
ncbi:MAG TPA: DUF4340 domain-containing protein [Gemmataceae bacterium]|nr:DUF4340 domain-containing protein [Gemmataceae bacterium]